LSPTRCAGAFLLDGGDTLFLWLGDQLPAQFVQELFGVQAKFDIPDAAEVEFGDISPLASKMALIVGQLRRDRNGAVFRICSSLTQLLTAIQFVIHTRSDHLPSFSYLQVTLLSKLFNKRPLLKRSSCPVCSKTSKRFRLLCCCSASTSDMLGPRGRVQPLRIRHTPLASLCAC
jgi:hypothetical protein